MSKLRLQAGQFSDRGLKAHNDDACGIRVPPEPVLSVKGFAALIADGVSSSEGGRQAAEACVQGFLSDYFSTPDSWLVKTAGQRVLGALNRWLFGQSRRIFGTDLAMISTASALVVKSATAHIFHIGDTRIYLLRDGDLECLTQDHQSWGGREKSFLTRAMGADVSVEIDYRKLVVENGDCFVLTTDGVHGFMTDQEINNYLQEPPEQACRSIVTHALRNGSNDNVTCQVIQIEELPVPEEDEFYEQLTELPFPPPLEKGMLLDGYEILREMHASKRTQIYLALDRHSGDKVVLKTPSVNFEDDAQYIEQFLHEEWAGRRISSPYVLKVIEPHTRRRFLYYVTAYLNAPTLRQWMNDHPQPDMAQVRSIAEQLAQGLRVFHRLEMLHQDIKPENIILDDHGCLVIIDFGSVKIAGIQEMATPLAKNHLLGTLDYAAPEYFQDLPGTVRSDYYAFGVLIYQLLTGQLPYGGPLGKRKLGKAVYISAQTHNKNIPDWVDAALGKAVALDPRHRYSTMSEFVYDLSHPNPKLLQHAQSKPIIERHPVAFWKVTAVLSLLLNIWLIYCLR